MGKICIHGYYGMGNLGDDAILKSVLREFGKYKPLELTVFSRRPEQVHNYHKVKSISSESKVDLFKRRQELRSCNLFVLGGGGLLKDFGDDSKSLKKWFRLLNLAQKYKVKTSIFAVGVENIRFDDSKILVKNSLANVDLITVRDKASKRILETIGVNNTIKVTTDPVVLLGNSDTITIKDQNGFKTEPPKKIAFCVRQWFDKSFQIEKPNLNENLIKSLADTADFLIKQYNAKLEFIPMRTISYDDDRIMANQIISKMKLKEKVKVHNKVPDIDSFISMLKQFSLLIGMRLHSLILSTSVGVPIIGLAYMPKVKAYMASINQSKYSLELGTLTSENMITKIDTTYKNYEDRCKIIRNEIKRLRQIAQKNIYELIELAT